jgi:hypothetical protein
MNDVSFETSLTEKLTAELVGATKSDGSDLNTAILMDKLKTLEGDLFALRMENIILRGFINENGLTTKLKESYGQSENGLEEK